MLRTTVSIGLLVMSPMSNADEYYEFLRVDCNTELSYFKVDSIGVWNIGEIVWPSVVIGPDRREHLLAQWKAHERSLERLEQRFGLYIFDQGGRYTDERILCDFGTLQVEIVTEKVERHFVMETDPVVYLRVNPSVIARVNGQVVRRWPISFGSDLTLDDSGSAFTYLDCRGAHPCENGTVHYSQGEK
jgi:hypothetical protein